MKKNILLTLGIISLCTVLHAQTNTFPASGNVGIGTTAPDQKLTVMGGIGFEHNSTDKKLYSPLDGVLEWMTHDGAGQHGFAVSHQGQKRIFLNTMGDSFFNGGNVGIGTNVPDQKLTVKGGIGFDFNSADKKLYSPNDGVLEWMTHNGAGEHGFAVSHQGQKRIFLNTIGNSFFNGGNVGIGTTNPQSALQIGDFNSNSVDKQITIPGVYNFEMVKLGQISNGNAALEMVNHNGSNSSYGVRILANIDNGGAGLQFQYAVPKTSYSELEYLTGIMLNVAGNVGIGTTAPKEKLSVNGKIRAQEIKVETANWPDYVFDQDYKILGLQELDAYIKLNKHLPEMPSAKSIESEGLAVGDMLKIQQKKIEELTLYLIEKDKALKAESAMNIENQKRIGKTEKELAELKGLVNRLIKK